MKKIVEWLQEMPEEIKSKAIINAQKEDPEALEMLSPNLFFSLLLAFTWSSSLEGTDYWENVFINHKKLTNKSEDNEQNQEG